MTYPRPPPVSDFSQVTPRQVKAGRHLLGWSQGQLGYEAGVAYNVVKLVERGARPEMKDLVCRTLCAAGVRFGPEVTLAPHIEILRPGG